MSRHLQFGHYQTCAKCQASFKTYRRDLICPACYEKGWQEMQAQAPQAEKGKQP